MIEYIQPWPELPQFKVPRLHRVNYNAKYQWSDIHYWCKANCQSMSYMAPDWAGTFVEFEDSEDAVLFALTYGG